MKWFWQVQQPRITAYFLRVPEKDEITLARIIGSRPDNDPLLMAFRQLLQQAELESMIAAQENRENHAEAAGHLGGAEVARRLFERVDELAASGRKMNPGSAAMHPG